MPRPDRAGTKPGSDAAWAEARRLYEQTDAPARDIAVLLGKDNARGLASIASRRGWKRVGSTGPEKTGAQVPGARRGSIDTAAAKRTLPASSRQVLIRKLERTVAREIGAIDARLRKYSVGDKGDSQGVDHERHAKALATLARTLRELAAIDRAETPDRDITRADADRAEDEEDDAFPRDADALRETLAQRLAQLSGGRKAR